MVTNQLIDKHMLVLDIYRIKPNYTETQVFHDSRENTTYG